MSALWQGSWATRARIATGLVLMAYVSLHLLMIGTALLSPQVAEALQNAMSVVVRSLPGTALLYGALALHGILSLSKLVTRTRLRLPFVDLVQIAFGLTIPLLLVTHVVFTRGSVAQFGTDMSVAYIAGLIWNSASGWWQAVLLIMVWGHGCIGLHMWLRLTRWWRRNIAPIAMLGAVLPGLALAGYLSEGRRAVAILAGPEAPRADFMAQIGWPDYEQFTTMVSQRDVIWWGLLGILCLAGLIYLAREIRRIRARTLCISYVDGPVVNAQPGPTLLEISQGAGVPHTALCGGRGRCTTCRVIVEEGLDEVPPPAEAERAALRAAGAPPGARLACQLCPTGPLRVFRLFQPDGRKRRHASDSKEAQLAILFLDMRGFTARTTGQLPYDVVHLLNRFFDVIVPPITAAGGTVDKYLGDGLLALFEMPDPGASARASLRAARAIGDALEAFNARLEAEGAAPVRIGLSLHLGTVVLGEIGAAGQSPRTLIGDAVNTASRLEAETKTLGVEALLSETVIAASGVDLAAGDWVTLELRGVAALIRACPVDRLVDLPTA